jgi:hypothetical protein
MRGQEVGGRPVVVEHGYGFRSGLFKDGGWAAFEFGDAD